jgi:hypothetical protein
MMDLDAKKFQFNLLTASIGVESEAKRLRKAQSPVNGLKGLKRGK